MTAKHPNSVPPQIVYPPGPIERQANTVPRGTLFGGGGFTSACAEGLIYVAHISACKSGASNSLQVAALQDCCEIVNGDRGWLCIVHVLVGVVD